MRTDEDRAGEREGYEGEDRLSVADVARAGSRQIAEITSKDPEGVISVEPTEDGWVVEVEMLEDGHVPSTSDVLAVYEVELDPDGSLLSYRRTQRYLRGRGGRGAS